MKKLLKLSFAFLFAVIIMSCSDDGDDNNTDPTDHAINSCEGCHTNFAALKERAKPDSSAAGGGCGGEVTQIEPYERVYIDATKAGFDEFKASPHGQLGCVACHNGVDNTEDMETAHSGEFIKSPSAHAVEKCGTCHSDEVAKAVNSIHDQGWGQKRKVTVRYGLAGAHEFDQLPQGMQEGYDNNCATCHANCGQCHVNKPNAVGGGLMNSHKFSGEPSMLNTCIACHKTRVGHAYVGEAVGTKPDVHLSDAHFDCMACHKEVDVHGDGQYYDQRFAVAGAPECIDCHDDIESENSYHSVHINTFSCNVCHSQNYNNCGSCHIGVEGARIPAYLDFKIGMNPIKDIKPYDMTVLRRTLMAPDSWSKFGIDNLDNFAAFPTYNYATPHNILKITERTDIEEGQTCFSKCHITKNQDGTYNNTELYLFESDLLEWEKEASQSIIVDDKLPASWDYKK